MVNKQLIHKYKHKQGVVSVFAMFGIIDTCLLSIIFVTIDNNPSKFTKKYIEHQRLTFQNIIKQIEKKYTKN